MILKRIGYSLLACLAIVTLSGWGAPPQDTHTVYLPLVNRYYLPGYINPFGVAMYYDVDAAHGTAQMAAAGSGWVVTRFDWKDVEPNPPSVGVHAYNWTSLDTKVNNARSVGLSVYVLLTGNPSWAAQYEGGPLYAGRMPDLLAFVSAVVARYPDVLYWTFYGEPDNGSTYYASRGWGYWGNNGAGYADLLAQLSPTIKAANPNAKLLISGLAYDYFAPPDGNGIFVKRFLGDVLQALNASHGGAMQIIDGMAFHYYPLAWSSVQAKASEIRGIMSHYGASQLPVWIPETGLASNLPGYNETIQAQMLVKMYVQSLAADVKMMAWLGVFDVNSGNDSIGLFRGTDFNQPKPSYFAYQVMARELYGARYLGALKVLNAEGYVFQMLDGKTKTVVWGTQTVYATNVPFNQTCISVLGIAGGSPQVITDSGPADNDGVLNGQVALVVGPNQPLYVTGC